MFHGTTVMYNTCLLFICRDQVMGYLKETQSWEMVKVMRRRKTSETLCVKNEFNDHIICQTTVDEIHLYLQPYLA